MSADTTAATGSMFEQDAASREAGKAEMRAVAERRLAAMAPATAPAKSEDNQGAPAGVGRTPDGKFAAKDNTTAVPATPDKAKDVPNAAGTVDRSFLTEFDEQYRKHFETLPDEAVDHLRKKMEEGRLKEKDYRQKTMSVAEREKALAAEEESLRFGRAVIRDPEMLGAVQTIHDKRNGKAPAATPEPFDHITATPEEFAKHEAEVRKLAADDAYARFRADQDAKDSAQSEKVGMALAAKAAFVDTGDYEPEQVNSLYDRLVATGSKFTKDNVVEILRGFLPPPKAKVVEPKPQDNLIPAASSAVRANGAASLARAGGVTPLVTTPAFMQAGKPPSSVTERLQEAVFQVNAKNTALGKDLISLGSR